MLDVTLCTDESDERISLEVYNAVWPNDAVTMDEVRSFKASVRAYVDHLARVDGVAVGSARAGGPTRSARRGWRQRPREPLPRKSKSA